MSVLLDLPNIGTTLANKLIKSGIANSEELKAMGSEKAILKIATLENSGVCINMLYALEGAIQGMRWHDLSKERKRELKEYYHLLENRNS